MPEYEAYCDGSFQSSINCGGWSSVILQNGQIIKKLYSGLKDTSNNRCELISVIETLKLFEKPVSIKIYSDSQYVINSIINNHVFKWIKEKDESKKNLDLWVPLLPLLKYHNVSFQWVKGHSDNEYNNLADMLAVHAAQCLNIPKDEINKINL